MAITIDYGNTNIIDIPQADLTLIGGTLYELDTDVFRLALKDIEDGEAGIAFSKTHNRNAPVTVAGITYAQTFEIIPPYKVRFENGSYTVRLVGSNNNIFDVENGILFQNTVQVVPTNSAGLIIVNTETIVPALTDEESEAITSASADVTLLRKLLRNKMITDPATGVLTVFDDDGTSILFQADMFEDAAGLVAYRGRGAERREHMDLLNIFGPEFGLEFS